MIGLGPILLGFNGLAVLWAGWVVARQIRGVTLMLDRLLGSRVETRSVMDKRLFDIGLDILTGCENIRTAIQEKKDAE